MGKVVKYYMALRITDSSGIYWDGLHYDAFNAAAEYGDFQGRPFSGASREQILVLNRRP